VKFNVKGENGLTTVANGDDVTVKLDDATKGKVDNAADRDLSNLTPDGKQQVKDLAAWNVVANNEMAEKVEGGNTVKFIDGDNISITQNGKDFTISTKKDVTFDTVTATQTITAPKVKAITGVETPQVTGLTNTTWVPGQTQPVSGRAATEDELHVNQWEPYEQEHNSDGLILVNGTAVSVERALQNLLNYLDGNGLQALHTSTQIIIAPGFTYKIVRMLVTNFHQPQSTLLLLVSAFIGGNWRKVYDYALAHDFRFLSYGDSSLLIP